MDVGGVDDDGMVPQFQFPWVSEPQMITVGDRGMDLRDVGAEVDQTPEDGFVFCGLEHFGLRGGGQFEVQLPGDLRDGGEEPLGDGFAGEARDGFGHRGLGSWRVGTLQPNDDDDEQDYTEQWGDDSWGGKMVYQWGLLSEKQKSRRFRRDCAGLR